MKNSNLNSSAFSQIPSVDKLLKFIEVKKMIADHGHHIIVKIIRELQTDYRNLLKNQAFKKNKKFSIDVFLHNLKKKLAKDSEYSLREVINLTGIILHSNLGRALLPPSVITVSNYVASEPSNIEFDISTGKRSEREIYVENKLCSLIGSEAATVVNNNAAAVMLVLNTLAKRKEVLVSRGELIEIGGSFRLPDIMRSANCKLREVGTTNRTNLEDYEDAIRANTALIFKAYSSNFTMNGYTKTVDEMDLVNLCKKRNLPLIIDLGSGTLIELERAGLKFGPNPNKKIKMGVNLVTFSGDKLMGGPQCGIITGRLDLIKKIKKNPMKRALRCDKFTISALSELLRIYQNPEEAIQKIPTLRFLSRSKEEIKSLAERVLPSVQNSLTNVAIVKIINCNSQVGSGTLPNETIPSAGISIENISKQKNRLFPIKLAKILRELPTPIICRIKAGAVILDLRCLEQEDLFIKQFNSLNCIKDL